MRLSVYFGSNVPNAKASWYYTGKCDDCGQLSAMTEADRKHLSSLMPGIEEMSRRILGGWFKSINVDTARSGIIELCARQGTSTGEKRFNFRSLAGWIELHDHVQ